ncbi:Hypothetical predicted protein [Mytilus galloprovincialis]|uniref:Small integral membrane protein 20 n=1 Tax=Mytilus galloprovincialis TaxID=29158 RepID=A0A8B6DZZ1_MYTGA|nr:Hypothetical predicted protein [Mytilus galloprovincialis]
MTGWRLVAFWGAFVGSIGGFMYAVAIYPMMNVDKYKELQKKGRAGLDIESIQPADMKVWSDPFAPYKKKKE